MIWLDAKDPYPVSADKPWGAFRGTCNQTSGNYTLVEKYHADAYALFSDIRYGESNDMPTRTHAARVSLSHVL